MAGSARHVVPLIEVEILDIDPTTEVPEVQESLRSCLLEGTTSEMMVNMTRRPFRDTRKAVIKLEESRALKLLKATHIKIRWVSCMVRKRTVASKFYWCLGFGHLSAQCGGTDRSKCCKGIHCSCLHGQSAVLPLR